MKKSMFVLSMVAAMSALSAQAAQIMIEPGTKITVPASQDSTTVSCLSERPKCAVFYSGDYYQPVVLLGGGEFHAIGEVSKDRGEIVSFIEVAKKDGTCSR